MRDFYLVVDKRGEGAVREGRKTLKGALACLRGWRGLAVLRVFPCDDSPPTAYCIETVVEESGDPSTWPDSES